MKTFEFNDFIEDLKVPDTATTWIASAVCTNKEYRLGVVESPVYLESSKPFFLDMKLPVDIIKVVKNLFILLEIKF